jgi:hypothetical protein
MTILINLGETAAPTTLRPSVSHSPGQTVIVLLPAKPVLDYRTYQEFIADAATLYAQGTRRLIIDLRGTTQIELSGLFALHNIARLYSGKELLDATDGWNALKATAFAPAKGAYLGMKLLASPAVAIAIRQTSLRHFLEVYDELSAAMASFVTNGMV